MSTRNLALLAVFSVVVVMFLLLPPMVARQDSVLNTYRALVEVDALARQRFVDPIEGDRLVHGAIRGMMFQLDPYSGYIRPDELATFERRMAGEYIGIGADVGMRAGRATIIAPLEGSPAARGGVLAGDVILSIDGFDAEGLSVFDIEERFAGKPASPVHLRLLHPGDDQPTEFTILRGKVSIDTVRGFRRLPAGTWDYLIDPEHQIGYVRVSAFRENTMSAFKPLLRQLAGRGVRGLILDLRFNPGGLMEQGRAMVDCFVHQGLILSTVTRRQAVQEYLAYGPGTITDMELAVLINGGSGSSSEIVAGSLQDHQRAVIVGERSFGKGSVQHLIRLDSCEAAIKLTVAYYCLPNGRIIHRTAENEAGDSWGVLPDVRIALNDDEIEVIQESWRELDLAPGPRPPGDGEAAHPENGAPPTRRGISRDRQLDKALAILREKLVNIQ